MAPPTLVKDSDHLIGENRGDEFMDLLHPVIKKVVIEPVCDVSHADQTLLHPGPFHPDARQIDLGMRENQAIRNLSVQILGPESDSSLMKFHHEQLVGSFAKTQWLIVVREVRDLMLVKRLPFTAFVSTTLPFDIPLVHLHSDPDIPFAVGDPIANGGVRSFLLAD